MKKMKKKIILGSLLAVFILMMLPAVNAVEYNTVAKANKSNLFEQIKDMDIEQLKEQLNNNDTPSKLKIILLFGLLLGITALTIAVLVIVVFKIILVEPSIEFEPNYDNNTLTVISVDHNYTLWSLIENNGTGSYNTSGLGLFVKVGDIITECSGEINLLYRPTNIQYERFVFS